MGQCPSGFVPYQGACVRSCPEPFQFFSENNQPRCVYRGDASKFVPLNPVASIPPEPGKPLPTLEELQGKDPVRYASYDGERKRVEEEIAVHLKTIDKDKQIADAFKRLQSAEDARDQAPEAYQMARVAYYTLTKGSEWIEGEKKRVASVEADPEVQRYMDSYKDIMNRKRTQQSTQDVMQSVKDGVLSLKDDVQYTTKTFQDQIAKLKNQINIERRGRAEVEGEEAPFYKWVDMILNILIIVGLLFAGFTIWRKLTRPRVVPTVYAPVATTVQ